MPSDACARQARFVDLEVKARLPIVNDNGVMVARMAAAADVKQNRKALRDAGVSRQMTQTMLEFSPTPRARTDAPPSSVVAAGPCAPFAHFRGNFGCPQSTPGGNQIGSSPALLPGSSTTNSLLGYETTLPRGIP